MPLRAFANNLFGQAAINLSTAFPANAQNATQLAQWFVANGPKYQGILDFFGVDGSPRNVMALIPTDLVTAVTAKDGNGNALYPALAGCTLQDCLNGVAVAMALGKLNVITTAT